jgi:predicted RNase H-like HicB family nuclease
MALATREKEMTVFIAVVIHRDPDSDYGVSVPDLPGCFSAGDSAEDALTQAQEAIELHLEGMLADGEPIPPLTPFETLQKKRAYRGGAWHLVKIDPSKLAGKAKRINVTIPEKLLTQIDKAAETSRTTRSGFLTTAAMEKISRGDSR